MSKAERGRAVAVALAGVVLSVRVQLSCTGEHVVAAEWGWQDGEQKPGTHTGSASEWTAQHHSASDQPPRYPI